MKMDEAVRLLNNRTEDEVELDQLVNQVTIRDDSVLVGRQLRVRMQQCVSLILYVSPSFIADLPHVVSSLIVSLSPTCIPHSHAWRWCE